VFQVDPLKAWEIVYNMVQFSKKQKEEQKLNINTTAVTSEATRVLKRLVSTIPKEVKNFFRKENFLLFCPM
jgi:hypothetical protein